MTNEEADLSFREAIRDAYGRQAKAKTALAIARDHKRAADIALQQLLDDACEDRPILDAIETKARGRAKRDRTTTPKARPAHESA